VCVGPMHIVLFYQLIVDPYPWTFHANHRGDVKTEA
jgi:hypothetical protein